MKTRNLLLFAAVPACISLFATLPIPAPAQELSGGVGGVTRDVASKQPVAQVQITAHDVNRGTDRMAISNPDGTFTITKLDPGSYRVAAARDGFIESTANVEVAPSKTYSIEFLLAAASPAAPEAKESPAPADASVSSVADELAALKSGSHNLRSRYRLAPLHSHPRPRHRRKPQGRSLRLRLRIRPHKQAARQRILRHRYLRLPRSRAAGSSAGS